MIEVYYGYVDGVIRGHCSKINEKNKLERKTYSRFQSSFKAYLPIGEQVKYYECSDFPFNFKLIGMRPAHLRPLSAQTVLNEIHKWIDNTPKGKLSNWVVS